MHNCILWKNNPDEVYSLETETITYSDIQGGYQGIGNINADPLFVEGSPYDVRLLPNSPCIDSGTLNGAPATDLDGNPRPNGDGVDMGAYEFYWSPKTRTYVSMPARTFAPGDAASCSVSVWNAGNSTLNGYPLFTLLDVFGNFYFAPSFSSFDYFKWSFPPGLTKLTVIPAFAWPEIASSASNLVWYSFMMNPEMTELASAIGVFDFGWGE
jgi:hypothetical protein